MVPPALRGARMRNRENPSRIRAQGLCHSSVYGCRERLFETTKNNSRTVPKHATIWSLQRSVGGARRAKACHHMVPQALHEARMRDRETPAGSGPEGYAMRPYTGAESASSKPLKTIAGPCQSMPPYGPSSAPWGTHAKQGNPSRIRAQGLCHASVDGRRKSLFETAKNNSRTVPKHATIWSLQPSVGHACETAGKPQQDPGPRAMPCVRIWVPKAPLRNR